MARVVRLTNAGAFEREEVRALFAAAFKDSGIVDFELAFEELKQSTTDPNVALLIGAEKGKLQALSVAILPRSALAPAPSVYRFYNVGSAKLREALVKATVDFFLEAGYTHFWGVNATEADDKVYARLFRSVGEAKKRGSILEFKIG